MDRLAEPGVHGQDDPRRRPRLARAQARSLFIASNPSLVWTGTEYAVTWSDDRDGDLGIHFARISAGGVKLDDVRLTHGAGDEVSPALVFNAGQHGLAWVEREGFEDLRFARLSELGGVLAPAVTLMPQAHALSPPAVAAAADGFGVAWSMNPDRPASVHMARLDAAGETEWDLVVAQGAGTSWHYEPALAWDGEHFAISYINYIAQGNATSSLYVTRATADGHLEPPRRSITGAVRAWYPSDIVPTADGWGLAWRHPSPRSVRFALPARDLAAGPAIHVVAEAPETSRPSLVWTGEGLGVAWVDARDGAARVWFNTLAPDGEKGGPDVQVSTVGAAAGSPSLAWTGAEYGLAWAAELDGVQEIRFAPGRFDCR